jgi:hypothetical protein
MGFWALAAAQNIMAAQNNWMNRILIKTIVYKIIRLIFASL